MLVKAKTANTMKTFTQIKMVLMSVALALAVSLPARADDDKEEKIKLQDCPASVQKTIKDYAGNNKILEIEKETKKDGTVIYEAEIEKADGTWEIEVSADGKLLEAERDDDDDDDDDDK